MTGNGGKKKKVFLKKYRKKGYKDGVNQASCDLSGRKEDSLRVYYIWWYSFRCTRIRIK